MGSDSFEARRANLFIGPKARRFSEVVAWTRSGKADPVDWYDGELKGEKGIWMSLDVWETMFDSRSIGSFGKAGGKTMWRGPSDDAVKASLERIAKRSMV